jgi:glycosyltransferase involved in cell wall biosynthesis
MKLAIITPRFPPAGGEDYSYHMAAIAKQGGHEVTVLTPSKDNQDSEYDYKGIHVKKYGISMSFGEFAKLWFPEVENYDILHFCGGFRHPHMFIAFQTKGKAKTILSPFFPVKPRANKLQGALQTVLDKTLAKRLLRQADLVLAETNIEQDWLKKQGVIRLAKLPNPLEDQYVNSGNAIRFREKFKIFNPIVFYLGGHSYIKNVEDLIEVTPFVNATFVIGGEGPLTSKYMKRLDELGTRDKVVFPGTFFDDIQGKFDAFAAASVFVLPSRMEGLGGVLIEAMAQGTPVVAANRGGLPDVVPDKWCLYEPGDITNLTKLINDILTDEHLSERLATLGYEKAEQYRYSKISKNYLNLLELVGAM